MPKTMRARGSALPSFGDIFVGRESELAAVSWMLEHGTSRLLTFTGPPGIGKTRLAIACAVAYAEQNAAALGYVDLVPIRDPDLVVAQVVQALGVDPRSHSDVIEQLAATDTDDRLIVLDNCEHLLAAASQLGEVLDACPRLRILATSRERLRLSAEQEFPVPPLAIPLPGDAADLEALAANPSVALLVDRARRTNPAFALTASNARSVVDACVRLEGLPLALELAAARLKLLTPGELAFRLGKRMELLAGSSRDVPVRQRALRSAIAWSHDLLNPAERALFRRLSVFAGSWTLADAMHVAGDDAADVLPVAESLLDKSLIRRVPADGPNAEFGMLDSLREYAAEQLESHGETETFRSRHAAHYAELAIGLEAAVGLPDERVSWPMMGRLQADLRVALDHCRQSGEHEQALHLATGLGWYCYTRGDLGSGQLLVDEVLCLPDEHAGSAPAARAAALVIGGILAWGRGQLDRSESLLLQALQCSEQDAGVRRVSIARAFLGHVARARGRYDEAERWHKTAAAGFALLGNAPGVAWAQHDLGLVARDRGDLDEAARLLRRSLRDFRDLEYPWAVAFCALGLGTTLCASEAVNDAGGPLGEALSIFQELDDPRGVAQCLEALAEVACERASFDAAARLIGSAAAQRSRLAVPPAEADRVRIEAVEQVLADKLGPGTAGRTRDAGRTMPVDQAVTLAVAVADGIAPRVPDEGAPTQLTRRERQVAALVASGRTNRQIGRALGIAEKTTEVHLHHVMGKLGVRSRAEVAAWAVSHDLGAAVG